MLAGTAPFALRYDERTPADLDPLQAALFAQLRLAAQDQSRTPPTVDQNAVDATVEICRGLPSEGPPPAALVDFGMRLHGLIDPPPHLVVADVPKGGHQSLAERLRERFGRVLKRRVYRRAGVATCRPLLTPERQRVVLTLFEGRARIEPVARRLALGTRAKLRARIEKGHKDIELVIADPRGEVTHAPLSRREGAWAGNVRCARAGRYRVELTGHGVHGIEVLANFPVYCAVPPPTSLRLFTRRGRLGSAEELEEQLVSLTNAFRRQAGVPMLKVRLALRDVARGHSRDMEAQDFVGHVSPTKGGPADRVRRAKLPYLVVRENVARAYSAREALEQLAQSPAHLSNLLNTDTSELGIGVVIDRRQSIPVLLITQNFLQPAQAYDPSTAQSDALRLIAEERKKRKLVTLSPTRSLDLLAGSYLDDYKKSGAKLADARLSAVLRGIGKRYKRVGGLLLRLSTLEAIVRAKELLRPGAADLGLAIYRDKQERVIVFALLGTRR